MVILSKIIWKRIDKFQLENKSFDQEICIEKKLASNKQKLEKIFSIVWLIIFLPLLFSLIGNEIDFLKIDLTKIGLQLATFFIGLIFRILASFFSVFFIKDLNVKEKIFMSLSWIPKATVQAAISPIALEIANKENLPTGIPLDVIFFLVKILLFFNIFI